MIRINLSGSPRPKKGKRGGGGGGGGEGGEVSTGPGGVIFIVLGLVLGIGTAGFFYWQEMKKEKDLDAKIAQLDKEASDLQNAKTKVAQLEKEKVDLENRKKAIDELVNNHVGPVSLMNAVGNTINATDAVWLNNMADSGTTVTMDGNALTTTAVANFMTKLKSSGYFKTVDIKDASEATVLNVKTFHFSLSCEKAPPEKPAQPEAAGAAPPAPGAAPARS